MLLLPRMTIQTQAGATGQDDERAPRPLELLLIRALDQSWLIYCTKFITPGGGARARTANFATNCHGRPEIYGLGPWGCVFSALNHRNTMISPLTN